MFISLPNFPSEPSPHEINFPLSNHAKACPTDADRPTIVYGIFYIIIIVIQYDEYYNF